MSGMLYRPKYRNAAGELVESAKWWCKIYHNGKPVRVNTHTASKKAAKDQMAVLAADAARNVPIIPKQNTKTVADLLADVLTDYKNQGLDSLEHAEPRITKHLLPCFGTWNAASVSDDQVRAYRQARMQAGAKVSTINREMSLLKRGYSLNKRCVTVVPAIPIPPEKNARRGFFEQEQFEQVRAALPDFLRPLLTVGYVTGWRIKSELLALEWRHVDFKARTLRLDPGMAKNDQGREFPFTLELSAALQAQRALTDAVERTRGAIVRHVFHRTDGERLTYWRRPWLLALVTAGLAVRECNADGTPNPRGKIIPGVILHDFRRTAIRNLSRAGVSEAIAMRLCGHETRSVFDRYNIVTGDDLRAGAAKLDGATGTVSGTVGPVGGFRPGTAAAQGVETSVPGAGIEPARRLPATGF